MTENSGWRSDRYQFGVDLKLLPRTTISADVFFEHDKNDLAYQNVPGFVLGASGLPVDIGLNFLPNTINPACITSAGPPPVLALTTTCTGCCLGLDQEWQRPHRHSDRAVVVRVELFPQPGYHRQWHLQFVEFRFPEL